MMNRATRWMCSLLALAAVFPAISITAGGCGSDTFTPAQSTDGGAADSAVAYDSAVADAGPTVEAGCLTVPVSVPSNDVAFCNAFAEVYDRCGSCEACRQSDVNNCSAFGDTFSESFKSAIVNCKDTLTDCDALQSETLGSTPCLDDQMVDAAPSFVQSALRTAYCSTCGDAGIPCDQFFFLSDGGGTVGTPILYVSDNIVGDIQSNCVKPADCGQIAFGICEANQLCNGRHAAPKSTCAQGLCK